jgi:hypothetical protein
MSEESEHHVGRRTFFKAALAYGVAFTGCTTALGTYLLTLPETQREIADYYNSMGALQEHAAVTMSPDEMKTRIAYGTRDIRIQETAIAYMKNPESLKEIMNRIPQSLRRGAVKIMDAYDHLFHASPYGYTTAIAGSGTVTSYDMIKNEIVILTTHDIFEDEGTRGLDSVTISQPHVSDEGTAFPSDSIGLYENTWRRIAVVVAQIPDGVSFSYDFGIEKIDEQWEPTIGETLYTLSYPGATYGNLEYFPSILTVTKKRAFWIDAVVADGLVGEGSSGAAVVKKDGTIVGVLGYFQPDGVYIVPVRDTYRKLLESAR